MTPSLGTSIVMGAALKKKKRKEKKTCGLQGGEGGMDGEIGAGRHKIVHLKWTSRSFHLGSAEKNVTSILLPK